MDYCSSRPPIDRETINESTSTQPIIPPRELLSDFKREAMSGWHMGKTSGDGPVMTVHAKLQERALVDKIKSEIVEICGVVLSESVGTDSSVCTETATAIYGAFEYNIIIYDFYPEDSKLHTWCAMLILHHGVDEWRVLFKSEDNKDQVKACENILNLLMKCFAHIASKCKENEVINRDDFMTKMEEA
ncbi:hypothetical protein EJ04DRAFT_587942 [Polyplosphaeria fusca]|uniref:Uncharacterized protein n=1 Tax=Polyplosphaeria fusca TaxID=682080 RepID=A0A9P4V6E6_9PLEO|nr:hypothetical protein EJ04DRAFT_587942 [Polyplosphaeria fusca]